MTPDEINQKHGKPTWRCWHCRAESGLEWWRGMSVAVCERNSECSAAFSAFAAAKQAEQDAWEESCREWWGE